MSSGSELVVPCPSSGQRTVTPSKNLSGSRAYKSYPPDWPLLLGTHMVRNERLLTFLDVDTDRPADVIDYLKKEMDGPDWIPGLDCLVTNHVEGPLSRWALSRTFEDAFGWRGGAPVIVERAFRAQGRLFPHLSQGIVGSDGTVFFSEFLPEPPLNDNLALAWALTPGHGGAKYRRKIVFLAQPRSQPASFQRCWMKTEDLTVVGASDRATDWIDAIAGHPAADRLRVVHRALTPSSP